MTLHDLIQKAYKNHFAIGAFNVYNLETVKAVSAAAQKAEKPVLMQLSEKAIEYAGFEHILSIVGIEKKQSKTPLFLHLDHGSNPELIRKCIKSGFDSVMFDGSKLPFEQNIEISRELRLEAHRHGVMFEAEIGKIGGKEDYVSSKLFKTDPQQAVEFHEKVMPDTLAVAIGNVHGEDVVHEELDFSLLARISDLIKSPLVLHGCSNRSEREYKVAIAEGVVKINIDTELRQAFVRGVTYGIRKKQHDPRAILDLASSEIEKQVLEKIRVFSCAKLEC